MADVALEDQADRAAVGGRRGPWVGWLVPVAVLVAVVVVHLWTAWDARGPIYFTDEVGYLSNAQLLSGVGPSRDLSFTSYYLGWSFLLVPLWWIDADPGFVYTSAVALSAACGVALIGPLVVLARRLGVAMPWAFAVAGVVVVAPARVLTSGYALAEPFLALVVAWTVVAAWRYAERMTHGRAAVLALGASWAFATHGRALGLLAATLLWFVVLLVRRTRSALTGVVVAIATSAPVYLLHRWAAAQMYARVADREESGLLRLTGLDPGRAAITAGGQAWYAVVGWLGLSVVGLLLVCRWMATELRRRDPSVATWAMVALAGSALVSVVWIAGAFGPQTARIDLFAYGRYLDPFTGVLALVGAAALSRGTSVRVVRWAAVLAGLVVVSFLGVVVPRIPHGPGSWWVPLNVSGLLHLDWPTVTSAVSGPWLVATALAALVLGAAVVGRRRWQATAVVLAGVILLVASFVGEIKTLRPLYAAWYDSFTLREVAAEFPTETISFDISGTTEVEGTGDTVSRNAYQFWLAPREVEVFDSATSRPETTLVVSRKDWHLAATWGARKIADDTGLFNNALWVMPGPLQEALASAGRLDDGP